MTGKKIQMNDKMTIVEWFELMKSSNNKGNFSISSNKEYCAVDAFFEAEKKKPFHLRSMTCMIACPCAKCRVWC